MKLEINQRQNKLVEAYNVLQHISAENVWLANFPSANTKEAYKRAVGDFIADMGIDAPQKLYNVTQAHIIAWRDHLKNSGLKNATIRNRLSALSSLFKFLADKQLCPHNPVSGVLRPNSGSSGLGSGKTPALTKRQVRLLLDAPMTHQGERGISKLQKLRDRAILYLFFSVQILCTPELNYNSIYRDERNFQ